MNDKGEHVIAPICPPQRRSRRELRLRPNLTNRTVPFVLRRTPTPTQPVPMPGGDLQPWQVSSGL